MASPFREHKTHLSFGNLIGELQEVLRQFPDKRTGCNITYSMEDVAAAFSVCFTQSPSFLAHQIALTETQGNSNAQTLFGIQKIPTE